MCVVGGAGSSVLSAGALVRCCEVGRVALPVCLAAWKAHFAEMCKFAVFVIALGAVKAQAERLVAVLELQILHGLSQGGHLPILFTAGLHLAALLAVAFAAFIAFAGAFGSMRASVGLEQCVDVFFFLVCFDTGHFMQCLVKGPPLAVQTGDLVPQFGVCIEQFMGVDGAEAGV